MGRPKRIQGDRSDPDSEKPRLKQAGVKLPRYHKEIVDRAVDSGRYGTASEFLRESIEVNGKQHGFAPPEDSSLSPRARQGDISPNQTNPLMCPKGELCKETP
jgi:hypothetical protein